MMKGKKRSIHQTDILGQDVQNDELRDTALAVFGNEANLNFASSESDDAVAFADSGVENSSDKDQGSASGGEEEDAAFQLSLPEKKKRRPAWVDHNDSEIKVSDVVAQYSKFRGKRGDREISSEVYEETLRAKYINVIGGQPEWADLDREVKLDSDDEEDDIIKHTGIYLKGKKSIESLPKTTIVYKKQKDLNYTSYSEGSIIKCCEFNPNSDSTPIALVAGTVGKNFGAASLFQVDGVNNHKIHTVKFDRFPIKCAHFTRDGEKFIVTSDLHGHFFVHDTTVSKTLKIPWNKSNSRRSMKSFKVSPDNHHIVFIGTGGELHLFDATALSHVVTLQGPSQVTDITFNNDGSRMYTHGESGEVFIWDMTTRTCIHKFYDDGCINGTSIALSSNSRYLACGSSSGIVNIYDTNNITSQTNPAPSKCIANLTTSISKLAFNSTSEILAMTSSYKNNSIKLVHFPSMQAFGNFPNLKKDMRRCQTVDFSPNSGYLSIGNNGGCAYLFRLKHYKAY